MGSVKVLTIAKVVRNGDVEIVKKYAFVFPSNEEATVAALLLRLQARAEFCDSALSLQLIETFDKDFGKDIEVDATDNLLHLETYTATYAYRDTKQPSSSITASSAYEVKTSGTFKDIKRTILCKTNARIQCTHGDEGDESSTHDQHHAEPLPIHNRDYLEDSWTPEDFNIIEQSKLPLVLRCSLV